MLQDTCKFEGWLTFGLPKSWNFVVEDDLIRIQNNIDPRGVIEMSFFKRNTSSISIEDALVELKNAISGFNLEKVGSEGLRSFSSKELILFLVLRLSFLNK